MHPGVRPRVRSEGLLHLVLVTLRLDSIQFPLSPEDGIQILIAPAAFEKRIFNKVPLSAHSQFFDYADRRLIENIERRNHPMFF